jgi:hypothetical protein
MAVVREQYAVESALVASITDQTTQAFDLARPVDTAEGNTIDFVTRPFVRKEFAAGKAFMTLNAALAVANVAVRSILILDLDGNTTRTILSVTDNAYSATLAATVELLKSILLRESEKTIRVTVFNNTGGAVTNAQIVCRFDFGLNAANYSSSPAVL